MSASFFKGPEGSGPPLRLAMNGDTPLTISACDKGLSNAPLALIGLFSNTSRNPACLASMVRIDPAAARYVLVLIAGAAIRYAPTPTFSNVWATLAKLLISDCRSPLHVGFGRGVAPALGSASCMNVTYAFSS